MLRKVRPRVVKFLSPRSAIANQVLHRSFKCSPPLGFTRRLQRLPTGKVGFRPQRDRRFGAGIEPTTARFSVWCSTVELALDHDCPSFRTHGRNIGHQTPKSGSDAAGRTALADSQRDTSLRLQVRSGRDVFPPCRIHRQEQIGLFSKATSARRFCRSCGF